MAKMQMKIDNILRIRKPEVPITYERAVASEIKTKISMPSIPLFSITEIDMFLKFEKDLDHKQFFLIVFHRVLKTCKLYVKDYDIIGTCLRVLISADILRHFEWNSVNNNYHSLSKCRNFINLFHKLTESVAENKHKITQTQICDFLRIELIKEAKERQVCVQMSKFPRLSSEQLSIVRHASAVKIVPYTNRVLVHKIKQRTTHSSVPTTSPSSIGIDESDLIQNEITSTEIDLNIIKTSEENDNALNDDDIEMQIPTFIDGYEEPEIDAPTNFNFDDSVDSILERNPDETESGFEIVNC